MPPVVWVFAFHEAQLCFLCKQLFFELRITHKCRTCMEKVRGVHKCGFTSEWRERNSDWGKLSDYWKYECGKYVRLCSTLITVETRNRMPGETLPRSGIGKSRIEGLNMEDGV